ncbi:MAG: LacI family DNA-binding transcriptional regulator [Candidatus Limnocylindrales bacterium]
MARLAGVSRAVVSVALSGRAGSTRLSASTRERVQVAAAQLGYTPHPIGAALRGRNSRIILFVPRSVREKPYEQAIPYTLTAAAMRALVSRGYSMIVAQPEEFGTPGPEGLLRLVRRYRIDGMLIDSPARASDAQAVMDRGIRVVQLMRPLEGLDAPAITVDPRPGMTGAIEHLRGLGHRRIAFIGQRGPHPTDVARSEAFVDATRTAGLEVDPAIVQLVGDYSIESGCVGTKRVLASDPLPTAILTSSDGLTLGVLRVLYERRLRVPDDMSLVSFDDAAVADLYPPVTSISQPLSEVAEQAVSLLLPALGDLGEPGLVAPLPTRLSVRASTGAPPDRAGR